MIHFDTSFLIQALDAGSKQDHRLREWIRQGVALGISSVSWTEFLCGPVEPRLVKLAHDLLREPLAYGPEDCALAAKLFGESGRRRGSMCDCMIAATALRSQALMATSDVTDFRRFEPFGLKLTGID